MEEVIKLLVIISFLVSAATLADAKMSVRIENQLPGTLAVHCASRDNDLKQQYIAAGQQYFFDFEMNFWLTTDFWCAFRYGTEWQQFDVWTGPGFIGQHEFPCHQCLWVVKWDGFYRTQEGPGAVPKIIHPWYLF